MLTLAAIVVLIIDSVWGQIKGGFQFDEKLRSWRSREVFIIFIRCETAIDGMIMMNGNYIFPPVYFSFKARC